MLPDHQEQSGKDIEQTAARFADVRAKYEAAKGNSGGLDASSLGKPTDGNQQVGREGSTQRSSEPMRPAAAFEDGGCIAVHHMPWLRCRLSQQS